MLLPAAQSQHVRRGLALLTSLLVGSATPLLAVSARAADRLDVQLDGLSLPLDLHQLDAWSRDPKGSRSELAIWFELLDERSRDDLVSLLRAPLLRDRGFALQLLQSWAGRQVLQEVGELFAGGKPGSGVLLLTTLRERLQRPEPIRFVELLLAVPTPQLTLDLDGLLQLAGLWRQQLDEQALALKRLRDLPLRIRKDSATRERLSAIQPELSPRSIALTVAHRSAPLELELWPAATPRQGSWVVLMPGLGGSSAQLGWMAQGLAARGWPVVLIEHPGSNETAVRQMLDGQRPPPGAETLPDRLADVEAVLAAEGQGQIPRLGHSVVLMGHSLGGLSALLASGLRPAPGLARRCDRALDVIPLINISRLLQCQLQEVALPEPASGQPRTLAAVVSLNGFGSLLWPGRGLERLKAPLLITGGGLDLVTPPVSEQLALFLQHPDPRSRLVMVEGGSHFSVVRVKEHEQALWRLGDGLVGVEPVRVQELLLSLTSEFLASVDTAAPMAPQRRSRDGVTAYVLDGRNARRWRSRIGR
ncbi:alpha/beta fold hydrolase [Synechococcus sp. 1G10]|uniref:alpha/beta fold hydrolase n=1 Tax=Synechococcus sp. 1G10 TaxID=2025605 RepID=UPI000B97E7FB|nr:alpha/beta fold hydrolase [Synechococcus sp. 1G10]